jgi:hypothetical protein
MGAKVNSGAGNAGQGRGSCAESEKKEGCLITPKGRRYRVYELRAIDNTIPIAPLANATDILLIKIGSRALLWGEQCDRRG